MKPYIQQKNTYSKYAARCRCGCWLPSGAWVRFKNKQVVACVSCRKPDLANKEQNDGMV